MSKHKSIANELIEEINNLAKLLTQDIPEEVKNAKAKIVFDRPTTMNELKKHIIKNIFNDYVQRAVTASKTEIPEDKLLLDYYSKLHQQVKSKCGTTDGTPTFEEYKEQVLKMIK